MKMQVPSELPNLARWFAEVGERESAKSTEP
jgi:hypothetical protein